MPDSDEAFKCPDCNKVYKTRTSLTRHSRNHAAGAATQYACEHCSVVFARRDILNRHVVNGHCGKERKDGKGAGRCHTACEGCRRSRVRCDGGDPCRTCVERNKECRYPKTTGRVSWLTRVGRPERKGPSDGNGADDGFLELKKDAPPANGVPIEHRDESQRLLLLQTAKACSNARIHTAYAIDDMNGTLDYLSHQPHQEQQSPYMHNEPLPFKAGAGSLPTAHQASPYPGNGAYHSLTASNPIHVQHESTGGDHPHSGSADKQPFQTPQLAPQHLPGIHPEGKKGYRSLHHGNMPTSHPHFRDDSLLQSPHLGNQIRHSAKHQVNGNMHLARDRPENPQTEQAPGRTSEIHVVSSMYTPQACSSNCDVQTQRTVNGAGQAPPRSALQTEASHQRPLETTPEVHHVSWPWLHERTFMGTRPKGKSNGRINSPFESTSHGNSSTPESLGSPSEMDASYRETITPLANVIESLVAYAANTAFTPEDGPARRRYWETTSIQLNDIFYAHGGRPLSAPKRTLYEFAEAFLQRFNVLWPLIGFEQLNSDTNHPVLFLVVTSIGAMFMPPLQRQYGALMHVRLRRLLCASLYDLEGPSDDEMIWLAQARVLTQIASLYFGQHQGFSYSQHLAAITIAQMRRMDYFREAIPDTTNLVWRPPKDEVARWQYGETRRRLALGILRTDAYNSMLLSARPLLTSEEVKLTFPRPDRLWLNEDALDLQGQLQAQRAADAAVLPMPLSDLVRIFLDRDESKPDLTTVGYELSLFGLQEWIWRFTHDTELYVRLTGKCLDGTEMDNPRTLPPREMKELRSDFSRLSHALDAWYQSISRAIARGDFDNHRDTFMCCMLLYRLTKLRMCSPLEDLHHISYRASDTATIDANIFRKVHGWMRTPFASEGAQQAWDIKSLIEEELRRPPAERARFNFLAFCSLHHSAVVLWTFAGVNRQTKTNATDTFNLPCEDVEAFIKDCANMFSQLSPLGGLSFESAARRLRDWRFPKDLPQYQAVR